MRDQADNKQTTDDPILRAHQEQRFEIRDPLVVMFRTPDGKVTTHIHPADGITYKHYGLLVCDLVRHVARAFRVDEDAVWSWVKKERHNPTTDITRPS
jgi:hypothetical protein